MKRIYKFPTGAEIPEGAVYLFSCKNGTMPRAFPNDPGQPEDYMFVWHYFLVEVL
jgi:hypothetical protein